MEYEAANDLVVGLAGAMGLGIVLIFWAVVGCVLGLVSATFLGALTWFLTRGVAQLRKATVVAAMLLPFACLAWAGAVFVLQALVNEGLLHRDLGVGDGWHAPLPNGYVISFIDVTDQGSICPARAGENGCTHPSIDGIRLLQLSGPYLLGTADSHLLEHFSKQTSAADDYFMLDTRDGKRTDYASADELKAEAGARGIALHLQPIYSVYSRYRFTWFDVFAGCLLVLPTLAALIALGIWVMRLRRNPRLAATTTQSSASECR